MSVLGNKKEFYCVGVRHDKYLVQAFGSLHHYRLFQQFSVFGGSIVYVLQFSDVTCNSLIAKFGFELLELHSIFFNFIIFKLLHWNSVTSMHLQVNRLKFLQGIFCFLELAIKYCTQTLSCFI